LEVIYLEYIMNSVGVPAGTTWNCSLAVENQRLLNSYTNISLKLSTTLSAWFPFGAVQIYMSINTWEVALCRPISCKLTAL